MNVTPLPKPDSAAATGDRRAEFDDKKNATKPDIEKSNTINAAPGML